MLGVGLLGHPGDDALLIAAARLIATAGPLSA
jgi:hypothetical protein